MVQYYNNNNDENIKNFLDWLDNRVKHWSDEAYIINNYVSSPNPKLKNWTSAALNFLRTRKADEFIYAKYGYAVEELTNIELKALSNNLSKMDLNQDYEIHLQVTSGSTRPDIVISFDGNKNYAWIDITSDNNVGHINRKSGINWHNAPIVAEVLYPDFNLSHINSRSSASIAERTEALRRMRQIKIQDNDIYYYMVYSVDKIIERLKNNYGSNFDRCPINLSDVQNSVTEIFNMKFAANFKYPIIKSVFLFYKETESRNYTAVNKIIRIMEKEHIGQDKAAALKYIEACYKNANPYEYY